MLMYALPSATVGNRFKGINTKLPLDLKLGRKRRKELVELERLFPRFHNNYVGLAERAEILNTENVGIHYFCLENNFSLEHLAHNRNLSPAIISLLNDKLKSEDTVIGKNVSFSLLNNSAVSKHAVLFEEIFNNFIETTDGFDMSDIFTPISLYTVNIDSFMLILTEAGYSTLQSTREVYAEIARKREDEIQLWLQRCKPDLAELPFSWVLRTYGL